MTSSTGSIKDIQHVSTEMYSLVSICLDACTDVFNDIESISESKDSRREKEISASKTDTIKEQLEICIKEKNELGVKLTQKTHE
jgi:hypothetical protein